MYSTLTEKQKIKHCFNKAAEHYDESAHLQKNIAKTLLSMMPSQPISTLIDLGCGTGLSTEYLAEKFLTSTIHGIDIANDLLEKAKNRLTAPRIHLYTADFDCLPCDNQIFDGVFSNMALHWGLSFKTTLTEITRVLKRNGLLVFSVALPGTFQELNPNSVSHFLSVDHIYESLHQQHYEILQQEKRIYPLDFLTVTDALRSIKNVGANYIPKRQHNGLRTNLNNCFIRSADSITLTYSIGFFVARKK